MIPLTVKCVAATVRRLGYRRRAPAEYQRQDKQHEKDEKQKLRYSDRGARDSAKAEDSRDQRDDKKSDGPVDHL